MKSKMAFSSLILMCSILATVVSASPHLTKNAGEFVSVKDRVFTLKDFPFRFGGTNNYYTMYTSNYMTDDLLQTAASNGFNVIRIWGFYDVGSTSESSVYFQYWSGSKPEYNDGSTGLQKLDYVVNKANELGLHLVISLVNNWKDFGGIQQYIKWRGGNSHDQFYTDGTIKQWYKDWVTHLLTRTNTYTGRQYKDEPSILVWELTNEARCSGDNYQNSGSCSPSTIANWVAEMAAHVKSIDGNHILGVGDEGFTCGFGQDWTDDCSNGDSKLYSQQNGIDYVSFHLYPTHWGKPYDWGFYWMDSHIQIGQEIGKPVVLGEFGWQGADRDNVYGQWTSYWRDIGGQGDLFWILAAHQDGGSLYPDYDGFTVYCPSSTCTLLTNHAQEMSTSL